MNWHSLRTKYVFRNRSVRGVQAPLASATVNGIELRKNLKQSVWNPGEDLSSFKLVNPEDFVIGLRSFQHGISYSTVRGLVSPAYTVFRATREIEPRFYMHYFRSKLMISRLENISQGIRQGRTIDTEAFFKMHLPVPPLEEQRRIADFLDAELSEVHEIVRLRQHQLATLAERERAIVDTYLTQEIDVKVALSRLCRIQTGVTVDSGRNTQDSKLRPYLRVANVKADGLELSDIKHIAVDRSVARRSGLQNGDVLMTEGGDIDKLGRGTLWSGEIEGCLHQNHVFAVRPGPRISGRYLALLTRTSAARSYFEMTGSKTTNLASTSSSKILAFRVPLPSREEQERRVQLTEQGLSRISNLTAAIKRQLDLLAERRQALITAAVTGQLDVTTARSEVR